MRARHKARKDALEVLFQKEITGESVDELVLHREVAFGGTPSEFSMTLINGVIEHQSEIDTIIRAHADHWALERMSLVDRNIIRIGLYEMLYEPEIPTSVSINEAVELAKVYGDMEDSSKFVNGILGRVASELKGGAKEA
ncbi:MAG: transcription antitermination factor NusB [Actinobacteria bacterium]|nr:transcription antitermination factor NusB [Actinomycetota bacterium]